MGLTVEGTFRIAQEHPPPGPTADAQSGDRLTWPVPPRSAVVLRLGLCHG